MKNSTLLLAGIAALCATPALAQTMSVPVSFAGIDIASPAGRAILDRRIDHATRLICGTPDYRDMTAVVSTNKCRATTLAAVQPRLAVILASAQPALRIAAVR